MANLKLLYLRDLNHLEVGVNISKITHITAATDRQTTRINFQGGGFLVVNTNVVDTGLAIRMHKS